MNNVYVVDINNCMVSRIFASEKKFNKIIDKANEVLEDKDVFTVGFCSNKSGLIKELKNIIRELESKEV